MNEINVTELNNISGAGIAYDLGFAIGKAISEALSNTDLAGGMALGA